MSSYHLRCRVCEEVTEPLPVDACRRCDGPTDVTYDWERLTDELTRHTIAAGPGTLWRYGDLLPAGAHVDVGAGWTPLVRSEPLSELLDVDLLLKFEDANPTRSYKDRVATLAVSAALDHGVTTLCCSSTGNLGDAVAAAAAATGLEAIVLVPAGSASAAVEAAHPGVHVLAVRGTYDDCRRLELELGSLFPWGFVSGNLHPYASEGAKTISFEIAEQLDWQLPDAVVIPIASGALYSKVGQGFAELERLGLAEGERPRLYGGQAEGCRPVATAFAEGTRVTPVKPRTIARSLAIGSPADGDLAVATAQESGGSILAVAEAEIGENMGLLAETSGVFGETAAGVTLGALRAAVRRGEIGESDRVVLLVTGDGLKTPGPAAERLQPVEIEPDADALLELLGAPA
jgi:threonine synthase